MKEDYELTNSKELNLLCKINYISCQAASGVYLNVAEFAGPASARKLSHWSLIENCRRSAGALAQAEKLKIENSRTGEHVKPKRLSQMGKPFKTSILTCPGLHHPAHPPHIRHRWSVFLLFRKIRYHRFRGQHDRCNRSCILQG